MRKSGIAMACVLFPMTIATGMAQAQGMGGASQAAESGVTAYGGYRSSSSLTETTTGQNVNVNTGASYALAVDIGLDRNRQVEIFYGRQKTGLTSGGFSAAANNLPLTIEYLHVGGTNFFEGLGKGVYLVGGIGVTLLRPDRAGLSSETKPSINLGVGYLVPIGRNLVSIQGTALYQGEALIGLSGRF